MSIQETTDFPEVKETIVKLRELSADEKVRQEAYYREKRLHDEASALKAEKKGEAKRQKAIIQNMRDKGFSEEQIKLAVGEDYNS